MDSDLTHFEFAAASRIQFGWGSARRLADHASLIGGRTLVVAGKSMERREFLLAQLDELNIEHVCFSVDREPTIELIRKGVQPARSEKVESIVALGGGSVLDAAKAIAAMAANPGDVMDYLEVIGKGGSLQNDPLPCAAIPTTAGTGSEVTRNAVLGSPEHRVKVSLRHPRMLPALAIVDPELTLTLPPGLTASTGIDALTQLIEPYVCSRANPVTDALCREGIPKAARSLRAACESPSDQSARADMALASLFGGLALANSGLGAVHGFAGPMGGMFDASHGEICAALLPEVMSKNAEILKKNDPDSVVLRRYREVARFVTGDPGSAIEDGVNWIRRLRDDLHLPDLKAMGIRREEFETLCAKASKASSMKPNPVPLSQTQLMEILEEAYDRK